jgi:predicted Zn-dependent protease with MMP-like domain
MEQEEFRTVVEEEWAQVPERFKGRIDNVALLVEDEPDEEVRQEEKLGEHGTLLGLYRGIPLTERGEGYGMVLPDTITLYRLPILQVADELGAEDSVRTVVRETLWHEIAHYFGYGEEAVQEREDEGTNTYQ